MKCKNLRIDLNILKQITNTENERNIYIHPNLIARDIFWQRLEFLYKYLIKFTIPENLILDFGGGSGVFSKGLCKFYNQVELIDLDTFCAEKIKSKFKLNNLKIIQKDINNFNQEFKYNIIIAADVLEHFKDLNIPIRFIKKNLSNNGKLFISLPTENFIYKLGRIIVGKQKPLDHYHSSNFIINELKKNNFRLIEKTFAPKYLVSIPLFEIAVFELA